MPLVRFLVTVLVPFLLALNPAAARPQEPPQPIRVRVDRVNVGAIVTDSSGHFIEGLQRANFHVFDNGVEQPLTDFAAVDEPAQVLLLLEAGPAVYLLQSGHLQAAHALFQGLSPDDRVAIARYAEAPQAVLEFTSDKNAAAAALEQVPFNLGFGDLNLSSSLGKVLDWEAGVQGKKSIVLLSTGLDTSPVNDAGRVMQRLKIADVRLLAVSLAAELQNAGPVNKKKPATENSAQMAQQFEQANQLLKAVAGASGGRAYFPASAKEFREAYAEIAQLVRNEYSLGFAPPAHDGLVHSIEVRIDAPQNSSRGGSPFPYRIDYRRAYLAPPPQ